MSKRVVNVTKYTGLGSYLVEFNHANTINLRNSKKSICV